MRQIVMWMVMALSVFSGHMQATFDMKGGSIFVPNRYVLTGSAIFSNSRIEMESIVTEVGTLRAQDSEFHKLYIEGSVSLNDCLTHKTVMSWGNLTAYNTHFLADVKICGGTAVFNDCNLKDLIIINENSYEKVVVYLGGYTIIQGSVIFTNGFGEVIKDSEVIILGDIVGGTIIDRWQ